MEDFAVNERDKTDKDRDGRPDVDEVTPINDENKPFPAATRIYPSIHNTSTDADSELSMKASNDKLDDMIQKAINTPLTGTVTQRGDIMEFVSDQLDRMIKMSSPIGVSDSESTTSSSYVPTMRLNRHAPSGVPRSGSTSLSSSNRFVIESMTRSTTSTSGWSNDDDLQSSASGWSNISSRAINRTIDPLAIHDLQLHTTKIAEDLSDMTSTLQNHIQKITSVTYTCLDVYKDSVNSTCNSVDASIKSMYALMAKCEQLCKNMAPVVELHHQIQEINRLLDLFEVQIVKDDALT